MRRGFLFDAICALVAGLVIGSLPGCEIRDRHGRDVTIGHKLPPVTANVETNINLPSWRKNVDPRHCDCCHGKRCLCGKDCTCRCRKPK